MGLLDKARETQDTSTSSAIRADDRLTMIEKIVPGLIHKLESQTVSLDYGPQIFRILAESFAIEKGVLFYKTDKIMDFNSLCSNGYDVTTNNRLRLNKTFFEDRQISTFLSKKNPFILEGSFSILKDVFSTREFGMIESLYFVPVFFEEELISVMVISAWLEFPPEDWKGIFKIIADTIAAPLSKSRMALMNDFSQNEKGDFIDHKDFLQKMLKTSEKDYFIIKLNLNLLIKSLVQEKNGFKAMNIKKEVLSVFKTMSGADVDIIELPENSILLVQKKDKIANIDLYLYQLGASLPLLYTTLDTTPDLQSKVYEYKSHTNPNGILEDLF